MIPLSVLSAPNLTDMPISSNLDELLQPNLLFVDMIKDTNTHQTSFVLAHLHPDVDASNTRLVLTIVDPMKRKPQSVLNRVKNWFSCMLQRLPSEWTAKYFNVTDPSSWKITYLEGFCGFSDRLIPEETGGLCLIYAIIRFMNASSAHRYAAKANTRRVFLLGWIHFAIKHLELAEKLMQKVCNVWDFNLCFISKTDSSNVQEGSSHSLSHNTNLQEDVIEKADGNPNEESHEVPSQPVIKRGRGRPRKPDSSSQPPETVEHTNAEQLSQSGSIHMKLRSSDSKAGSSMTDSQYVATGTQPESGSKETWFPLYGSRTSGYTNAQQSGSASTLRTPGSQPTGAAAAVQLPLPPPPRGPSGNAVSRGSVAGPYIYPSQLMSAPPSRSSETQFPTGSSLTGSSQYVATGTQPASRSTGGGALHDQFVLLETSGYTNPQHSGSASTLRTPGSQPTGAAAAVQLPLPPPPRGPSGNAVSRGSVAGPYIYPSQLMSAPPSRSSETQFPTGSSLTGSSQYVATGTQPASRSTGGGALHDQFVLLETSGYTNEQQPNELGASRTVVDNSNGSTPVDSVWCNTLLDQAEEEYNKACEHVASTSGAISVSIMTDLSKEGSSHNLALPSDSSDTKPKRSRKHSAEESGHSEKRKKKKKVEEEEEIEKEEKKQEKKKKQHKDH